MIINNESGEMMIDLHCHILPGVDDGAENMEDAIAMARLAAQSGVTDIVATPHFRGERSSMQLLPLIDERLAEFREAIKDEGIDIKIHSGAEILCLPETPYLPKDIKLPTIGQGNYILTEFYFDETEYNISESLRSVAERGYIPVVAHPERYEAVQGDPRILARWFREGYVLQVNKGSVMGAMGRGAERVADFMLENGLAHVIASDAHSPRRRTTDMRRLNEYLSDILDEEYVEILLRRNASRILRGKNIVPIS